MSAYAGADPYALPAPRPMETAPITEWMTHATGQHMSDVQMPDGHVVRALSPDVAAIYLNNGGICLPRNEA